MALPGGEKIVTIAVIAVIAVVLMASVSKWFRGYLVTGGRVLPPVETQAP